MRVGLYSDGYGLASFLETIALPGLCGGKQMFMPMACTQLERTVVHSGVQHCVIGPTAWRARACT